MTDVKTKAKILFTIFSYCPTSKDFKAEIGFEKRVVVKPMYDADLRTASGPGRNETIM